MTEHKKRKPLIDFSHPNFRPMWVRVLIVAACIGWAGFEMSIGSEMWAAFFAGIGAWCGWEFFVKRTPDRQDP